MRFRHPVPVLLLLLAACAGGRVILQVDILSFLAPEDRATGYAAPLGPIPIQVDNITWGPDSGVNLVEALADVTTLESARLLVDVTARNRKGRGRTTVRLRLAETQAGLDDAASIVDSLQVEVAPDSVSHAREEFELADSALALFEARGFFLRLDLDIFAGAGALGDSLAGWVELNELRARVVTEENFFGTEGGP